MLAFVKCSQIVLLFVIMLLYFVYHSQTNVCHSMKKNFPKLASKLTTLLLHSVSIGHSCVSGLAYLLNSSLIHLQIELCKTFEFNELTTAIGLSNKL